MTDPAEGRRANPLSATDWHVLLAIAEENLHGYAIMKRVFQDSEGAVSAEIGSLYRILSRLLTQGFVAEVDAPRGAPAGTRGRARRYYHLTNEGRRAMRQESARLARAIGLARDRRLMPGTSK